MFIFREIKSQKLLTQTFQMRYEIYQKDPQLCKLIDSNPSYMSLDGYDAYAHHYGVYWATDEISEITVGYIRIIRNDQFLQSSKTISLITDELGISLPDKLFPYNFNTLFPKTTGKQVVDNFKRGTEFEICEAGRFIIVPNHRSLGLAQFIIECVMTATYTNLVCPIGVIYCRQMHKPFYERNGFEWIAVEESPIFPKNPWHLLAITHEGALNRLPDLEERIEHWRTCGEIIYKPKIPI